jgi:hypothetical protein
VWSLEQAICLALVLGNKQTLLHKIGQILRAMSHSKHPAIPAKEIQSYEGLDRLANYFFHLIVASYTEVNPLRGRMRGKK